jgi:UDP-N-acetylglucosamine--N-acetylmuramyl-(pentapeptide) pyrophosphoryl-undecaprenol N-acetylglucosamine transferase
MVNITGKRDEAFDYNKLDANKKTILVIGGSLGARTLNQAMMHHYSDLKEADVQVLWQSGKLYFNDLNEQLKGNEYEGIKLVQFIDRMDLAYAMADVIISRAGAISVSELCLIKKPVILVPSPNVAEDHQTKNAMALVEKFAAILVKDVEAKETLIPAVLDLLKDEKQQVKLADEIAKLGKPKATESIVDELERINTAP